MWRAWPVACSPHGASTVTVWGSCTCLNPELTRLCLNTVLFSKALFYATVYDGM